MVQLQTRNTLNNKPVPVSITSEEEFDVSVTGNHGSVTDKKHTEQQRAELCFSEQPWFSYRHDTLYQSCILQYALH
jgi:hypothetical protein